MPRDAVANPDLPPDLLAVNIAPLNLPPGSNGGGQVMRTTLICDRGRLFDSGSPVLRAELRAWHLAGEFVPYVIRNLGFIAISGNRHAPHVRLRPATVAPRALAALADWLAEAAPERLALSTLGQAWQHRLIATGGRPASDLVRAMTAAVA